MDGHSRQVEGRAVASPNDEDLLIKGAPRRERIPSSLAVRPPPGMEPPVDPELHRCAAPGAEEDAPPVESLKVHVDAEPLSGVNVAQAVEARPGGGRDVSIIPVAITGARGRDD